MRVKLRRAVYIIALSSTIIVIWILLHRSNPEYTKTCELPASYQTNLLNVSYRVHDVLDILRLTHCLCYGALWGQIRQSTTLPWESDVEFCVINKELAAFDENFIIQVFKKHKMTFVYDSAEGMYLITDEDSQKGAKIKLVVFEEDPKLDVMRRVGWKRRVLPPNCEDSKSLDCFPVHLLRKPLPMKSFGWKKLPVPWEGLEILKYHYPDTWWKEVIPFNC